MRLIGEVRAGMVATVCELRTALQAAIPGAVLTFNTNWFKGHPTATHPVPTDAVYDVVGISECVDYLNPMAYCFSDANSNSARGSEACTPLPALRDGLQSLLARGIPRTKPAPLLPLIGEDFNCDLSIAPVGGRTNAYNCTTSPASQHTIDQPGYGHAMRMLDAGNSTLRFDAAQSVGLFDLWRRNATTGTVVSHRQIFIDTPKSIEEKVSWSRAEGLHGVGIWTADAVADKSRKVCPQNTTQTIENARSIWAAVRRGIGAPLKQDDTATRGAQTLGISVPAAETTIVKCTNATDCTEPL
eukprot:SAG11_NODE_768_length_7269_cov_3.840725_6_plen_300_part_00